jgi:hypothetical protein
MKRCRPRIESDIPLFLLPQAIAGQIRERGSTVYRISVKRTHWHYYNVTVRTKSVPRELAPRSDAALSLHEASEGAGTSAADSRECTG